MPKVDSTDRILKWDNGDSFRDTAYYQAHSPAQRSRPVTFARGIWTSSARPDDRQINRAIGETYVQAWVDADNWVMKPPTNGVIAKKLKVTKTGEPYKGTGNGYRVVYEDSSGNRYRKTWLDADGQVVTGGDKPRVRSGWLDAEGNVMDEAFSIIEGHRYSYVIFDFQVTTRCIELFSMTRMSPEVARLVFDQFHQALMEIINSGKVSTPDPDPPTVRRLHPSSVRSERIRR